ADLGRPGLGGPVSLQSLTPTLINSAGTPVLQDQVCPVLPSSALHDVVRQRAL
ncbi:hypothetical protein M9458_045425, partial [Cirrhinus mrigala]